MCGFIDRLSGNIDKVSGIIDKVSGNINRHMVRGQISRNLTSKEIYPNLNWFVFIFLFFILITYSTHGHS